MATIALPHPTSPRHRAEMLAGRPAAAAVALALPFALPKLDDFLTAAAPTVAATEPASVPAPAFIAARPEELARLAWERFGDAGARLAEDFARGLRDAEARESLDLAFAALESSENLYFDGDFALQADLAPVAEPELVATTESTPAELAPLPGFEVMEQSADLYFAAPLADETAPAPEAFAAAPAPLAEPEAPSTVADAGLAALPDDVFAPTDPVSVALAEPETTVPPDVNRAVRLTREALSAWVNVLTGPAVVTASHTASVTR
jgi:hypothetical protein